VTQGFGWANHDIVKSYRAMNFNALFDGILFIERSTPSRPTPNAQQNLAHPRPSRFLGDAHAMPFVSPTLRSTVAVAHDWMQDLGDRAGRGCGTVGGDEHSTGVPDPA
jgi:hypothetical protein